MKFPAEPGRSDEVVSGLELRCLLSLFGGKAYPIVAEGTSNGQPCYEVMSFSDNEHDAETRALMTAAYHTAWTAICLARAPAEAHQAAMASAIVDAVAAGERDFMRLQQVAINALDTPIKAADRRQQIRLVSGTDFDAPR